jgi:hypothetical protein
VEIKESDWKIFRKVREPALERYCQRVLEDVRRLLDKDKGAYHERYLKVWELLRNRDKTLALAFNDPRRSQAIIQLANIKAENLLTEDELNQFSAELLEHIELIRQLRNS